MTPEPKSCSPGECILHEQIWARKMIKWLMISALDLGFQRFCGDWIMGLLPCLA